MTQPGTPHRAMAIRFTHHQQSPHTGRKHPVIPTRSRPHAPPRSATRPPATSPRPTHSTTVPATAAKQPPGPPLPAFTRRKEQPPVSLHEATEPAARLLLTVEEAAGCFGVGRSTMYGLILDGEVESIHVGRLRRVPMDALWAYIQRKRSQ